MRAVACDTRHVEWDHQACSGVESYSAISAGPRRPGQIPGICISCRYSRLVLFFPQCPQAVGLWRLCRRTSDRQHCGVFGPADYTNSVLIGIVNCSCQRDLVPFSSLGGILCRHIYGHTSNKAFGTRFQAPRVAPGDERTSRAVAHNATGDTS